MKDRITNPFLTGGYVSPDYFCNRIEESKKVMNAISSRRNLTIISLRRMGKTGLLKHVKYQLEHSANPYTVVYVDLLPTMNVNEMLNLISSELVRLKKDEKNFFEKILAVLASLRPRLTIDSLTGEPSIELLIQSNTEIRTGLDHLIRLIAEIRNNVVFMFDEFQQIGNYPEKNIEQILRSIIQMYPVIPFIFSGSSKHLLENMFLSATRPFYQSSELMYLDRIQEDDYRMFITDRFLSGNKTITGDSLTKIFEWTRLHTYYVQYICNLLFEMDKKTIETDHLNSVFHRVLTDSEQQYISYRNLLPPHQFRLLQAVAVEDGVTHPTSGKFIMRYNLTSASSVNTSLKALQEKEMIVQERGKWQVYDVFFSRWLEHKYRRQ
jgi:AAA+ ATPase superfamily predicted ATPase